jgi:hypothetical protein
MISQLIQELKTALSGYPKQQSKVAVFKKYLTLQNEFYHGRKIVDLSSLNLLEDCVYEIISKEITSDFEELLIFIANVFRFNNKSDTIGWIINYLPESSYKMRLQAFVLHRRLDDIKTELILIADDFFELINNADLLSDEDISIDLANDIYEFYQYGRDKLKSNGYLRELSQFKVQFSTAYSYKCPLLLHPYFLDLLRREDNTVLIAIDEEITELYQPSEFIDNYFNKTILQPVKLLPNTALPATIFGFHKDIIRKDILEYGLTNFDCSYNNDVTPDIKVLLYSYFNLRKHYFSMHHIFRKIRLDQILLKHNLLVVDIGSGPGTAGLAVADYVNRSDQSISISYLGIDISETMNRTAFQNLSKCTKNQNWPQITFDNALSKSTAHSCAESSTFILIVASYLFASKSLDEVLMAAKVNELLEGFMSLPIMFVYQNPDSLDKNFKYSNFKQRMSALNSIYLATETIYYKNRRNATYEPSRETVYYEVLVNDLVKRATE